MSSMRVERKTDAKNGAARLIFIVIALVLQVAFLYYLVWLFGELSRIVQVLTRIAAFMIVLVIYGRHMTSSRKMPWLVMISFLPILGIILWYFIESEAATGPMRRRFDTIERKLDLFHVQEADVQEDLGRQWPMSAGVAQYLWRNGHYPLCRAQEVTFFGDTCKALKAQLEDLEKAEHFIFMEYYAIEDKEAFAPVHDVLRRKVAEGVEVRLFFDDIGSIFLLNGRSFMTKMQEDGIQTRVFNKVMPSLRIFMNNRDHHKIMVVDGRVAYTGGYNLADEYFNLTHPYGEWSDAGIRVTGTGVHTFTTIFLEMWNAIRESDRDDMAFDRYYPGLHISEETIDLYVSRYAGEKTAHAWNEYKMSRASMTKALESDAATIRNIAAAKAAAAQNETSCEEPSREQVQPSMGTGTDGADVLSAEGPSSGMAPAQRWEAASEDAADAAQGEFIQPYADSPLDERPIGEDVYLSIINQAQNYVWFVTPYLVITDEMSRALTLAAERGVDVRIVTPGIPDKKTTYQLTRSYYAQLVHKGVRIYEFRPGFCHDKICASDDRISTCGTINLDYRSLYHHFEDGCVMYSPRLCADVRGKIEWLMSRSEEVTEKYREGRRSLAFRTYQCILRFFAPLM